MHILALEPYDGGSHAHFLDGLITHSTHRFTRLGMPARKWKWRMRGSSLFFVEQIAARLSNQTLNPDDIDLIFTCDMTGVTDLKALLPPSLAGTPIVCYFHENQLTYPVPDESQRDYQYAFTNITSCLTADALWFNSHYHLDSFCQAVETLLAKMPDCVPTNIPQTIAAKAIVMPLGLAPDLFDPADRPERPTGPTSRPDRPTGPTIIWNHRWEYDKNPEQFFETLFDLQRADVPFRLIVAGQSFRQAPPIFAAAQSVLKDRIDHFGYVPNRTAYLQLLRRADIVVSTAYHEFFGLAVLEAIAAGCFPLLPDRLSYPELLPTQTHAQHLYRDSAQLHDTLTTLCRNGAPAISPILIDQVASLAWPTLKNRYDQAFQSLA